MDSQFFIELNMKTVNGFERFGCFEIGNDSGFAAGVFAGLEGLPASEDTDVLHLDLVEKRNGLPVNIQMLSCTVDQLGNNMKFITRELFKRINLNDTLK